MKHEIQKTFIILLERDLDRVTNVKQNIISRLSHFEIIPAIDWQKDDIKDIIKKGNYTVRFATKYEEYCLKGKIACSLSHIKVWERIIQDNLSFGIVLEDDVSLLDNFNPTVRYIIKELPDDFDIVYLYVHEHFYTNDKKVQIMDKEYLNKYYFAFGRCAYLISHQGCQKLLNYFKIMDNCGDLMINDLIIESKLNAYTSRYVVARNLGQLEMSSDKTKLKSNIWESAKYTRIDAK